MNTDTNAYSDNAEAEQQLDSFTKERANHPKVEELTKGRKEMKSYYIVAYKMTHSDSVNQLWHMTAVEAMAFICKETLCFNVKHYSVMKFTITGDMFPNIKEISVHELNDEAFMESNYSISAITAP